MPDQLPQQHQIRVFISSTFRDMHAEREELVKRVFPQLRKLCERRGVAWTDVDLRWGVTDEQKAEGHALPICLAEIERCRPYFIGLLGERYGPPVDKIDHDVLAREPWLKDHLDRSLTEIEILHGVLRNPAQAEHALFYFRDPAYLERLPPGTNPTDFRSENSAQAEQLRRLKTGIRLSGCAVQENYADPKTLGQLVLADFTDLIERLYPEGSQPSSLDRECIDQNSYAAYRERAYVRRQAHFDMLDRHAAGLGKPLVVLGESGVGKSALLANWALEYRRHHPEELVLLHLIGATPYSSDWVAMVRRIMGEFDRRLGVEERIPDQPEDLRLAFGNALYKAATNKRVILVLDGLNQLEEREGAQDLGWLPAELPVNLRLVISTLPGKPLEEAERRQWQTVAIEPLNLEERREVIHRYLHHYGKVLTAEQVESIANSREVGSPLYLRTLLEELRLFGEHDYLERRINHYLGAKTISELYDRLLARYEEDYERERPHLVRDTLRFIWAARRGLSESELLELLGTGRVPLAQASWSPFYLAATESFVNQSGLVGFAHRYLREAVRLRFLRSEAEPAATHLQLADYFQTRERTSRQLEELPWQLAESQAWPRLCNLLTDLSLFDALWESNELDAARYWTRVEANSPYRMIEAYSHVPEALRFYTDGQVLTAPREFAAPLWSVASLLNRAGHSTEALAIREYLVKYYVQTGDSANLIASLGNQSHIVYAHGEIEKALALLKEQEWISRHSRNKDGLQSALGDQAIIFASRGDLDRAFTLLQEQESICRESNNLEGLVSALIHQAHVFDTWGEVEKAFRLDQQAEQICRASGDQRGLQISLAHQATILRNHGRADEALVILKAHENISRELGDKTGLQASLGHQAIVFRNAGRLDEAMACLKEQEGICRALGSKYWLAFCLGVEASILTIKDRTSEALVLLREQEQLLRDLGDKRELAACLGNQAMALKNSGDPDRALTLLKEVEKTFRELRDYQGIAGSLSNQAMIFNGRGNRSDAIPLLEEAERICRQSSDIQSLSGVVGNKAIILMEQGEFAAAYAVMKEHERLCRQLGDPGGIARALGNQALLLARKLGQKSSALGLMEEAYRLVTDHGLEALMNRMRPFLDSLRHEVVAEGIQRRRNPRI